MIAARGAVRYSRDITTKGFLMGLNEYEQGTAFPGVIGRTTDESEPAWPASRRAKPGAPNVLMIVLDDAGFGHLGCYGSPIETPHLDALAAGGLRFRNMHTTALCSPSRSCILTGRNHHSNGLACITEFATGYPGYNGIMPFENGFLSEMLLEHGYSTFMVGKYHLTPSHHETAVGPYDRWPLGRGFERYYGFLGGDTSQWNPDLVYDNHPVEPPRTPEEGYHLTEDLADKAVQFIADAKQVDPDKPFYLHFCTGAPHAPHHVATEWADRYRGVFDDGWDAYREKVFARQQDLGIVPDGAELSRHDPDVPEWESLSADPRRLYSRMMEVFAGFLSHADHHIGRLLSFLESIGQLEDTLIMVVSDNGASAEGGLTGTTNEAQFFNNAPEPLEESLRAIDKIGGPTTFNHYPWGWTWAGNTPFPALEAGDLSRRRERPVHRPLARRDRGPGRGSRPVRAPDRHGPDRARSPRDRAAGDDQRRHPGAASRRELRARARRTRQREPPPHPVLRDARPPLDLPRRVARGVPVARAFVHRGRQRLRRANPGVHADRARCPRLGAVSRGRGLRREPQPRG
jgi:arylsulfatase A-like enzyme